MSLSSTIAVSHCPPDKLHDVRCAEPALHVHMMDAWSLEQDEELRAACERGASVNIKKNKWSVETPRALCGPDFSAGGRSLQEHHFRDTRPKFCSNDGMRLKIGLGWSASI
eukprot:763310-Hanusia_phi.AAC.7